MQKPASHRDKLGGVCLKSPTSSAARIADELDVTNIQTVKGSAFRERCFKPSGRARITRRYQSVANRDYGLGESEFGGMAAGFSLALEVSPTLSNPNWVAANFMTKGNAK